MFTHTKNKAEVSMVQCQQLKRSWVCRSDRLSLLLFQIFQQYLQLYALHYSWYNLLRWLERFIHNFEFYPSNSRLLTDVTQQAKVLQLCVSYYIIALTAFLYALGIRVNIKIINPIRTQKYKMLDMPVLQSQFLNSTSWLPRSKNSYPKPKYYWNSV